VKYFGFLLAVNAIEMAKVKLQQSDTERVLTSERQATELAETRNSLVYMIERTMTQTRTINHIYN
jgi:hypothetical protein